MRRHPLRHQHWTVGNLPGGEQGVFRNFRLVAAPFPDPYVADKARRLLQRAFVHRYRSWSWPRRLLFDLTGLGARDGLKDPLPFIITDRYLREGPRS